MKNAVLIKRLDKPINDFFLNLSELKRDEEDTKKQRYLNIGNENKGDNCIFTGN